DRCLAYESSSTNSAVYFTHRATSAIHTLSLHDALPIWRGPPRHRRPGRCSGDPGRCRGSAACRQSAGVPAPTRPLRWGCRGRERPEEHTSELQSRENLVCRLQLAKKKQISEKEKHARCQ